MLATSRVRLKVYGEHEYIMPALSLPPKGARLSPQQLISFDAVKLFVTRVQAFKPSFQLTLDNVEAILDICERMDGMPLAIELAAAHLRRGGTIKTSSITPGSGKQRRLLLQHTVDDQILRNQDMGIVAAD